MRRLNIALTLILLPAVIVMSAGCKPKRQFYSDWIPDQEIVEEMILTTEFSEYGKDVDKIRVNVVNNSDSVFTTGEQFLLQKKEDGEWRGIAVTGAFTLLAHIYDPAEEGKHAEAGSYTAVLKDHVLQPLPPGIYRIGISTAISIDDRNYKDGRLAYSNEFAVK